jgi:signal transduction histidine kinase
VSLSGFLRGKAAYLGIVALSAAVTSLLNALVFEVAPPFVLLAASVFFAGGLLALLPEYLAKNRYYRDLDEMLACLDKKHLLVAVLTYPEFEEGRILYDALQAMGKSMNDEIRRYASAVQEYREYIELCIHEAKTPIAGMKLLSENIHDRDLLSEVDRIDFLVEQVLFYARSTTVEKDYRIRRTGLEQLVNAALKGSARQLIAHRVRVRTDALGPEVLTDAKWVEFVLRQIIDNSVKYGATSLVLSAEQRGPDVALSVQDDGVGIEERDLGRVFEKGFTGENGRRYGRATGLGLYLCHKLCAKLGLGISVRSVAGEGTTVELVFPHRDPFS